MATEEQNIALIRRLYEEVVNAGNFDLMDVMVSEDVIEHEEMPGLEPNREGVKQFFAMFRSAFPDLRFHAEEILAVEDKVVARLIIQGTHQGEFMGMPPTGKKINVKAIDIMRIADGKVAEHWGVTDTMTMMHQLGAIPGE